MERAHTKDTDDDGNTKHIHLEVKVEGGTDIDEVASVEWVWLWVANLKFGSPSTGKEAK